MAAVAALGTFGLLIGSFLNVVIYRVPLGRSIVSPPSACGNCGHEVRAYDNIPLVSWLLLRGKCRDCAAPISVRYPIIELAGGVFFALVALRFVPVPPFASGLDVAAGIVELVAFLYFAAISLALAVIDVETRRLPNALVLPAYPVAAVMLTVVAALTGAWTSLLGALAGGVILGGLYLILALARPGGMGFGDVKLAGVIGILLGWIGWDALAVGSITAFLLGGIAGVGMLLAGRGRKASLAFGPWMLVGAWVGILAGAPLAHAYLGLFGIAGG
jgi:leader peptidase (prepilin peptidase)/N-methyltransferase